MQLKNPVKSRRDDKGVLVSHWPRTPLAAVTELGTGRPLAEAGLAWGSCRGCVSAVFPQCRISPEGGTRGEISTTTRPTTLPPWTQRSGVDFVEVLGGCTCSPLIEES